MRPWMGLRHVLPHLQPVHQPVYKYSHLLEKQAMFPQILLLLFSFAVAVNGQYAMMPFGGGCGGCPQPSCAPRPVCAQPVVCPPPAPCPPQFCPPPPICPPPPPPIVCPPPPPPPPPCSCQMQRPMYYPAMPYPQYGGGCGGGGAASYPMIPAQNDCCCGCSSPCRYRGRARKAAGVKTVDPSCNNEEIRKLINEFISDDASESKRTIQARAEQSLGHMVNVICGKGEFSYIAHTESFCQATKDDVTCYAFKPI